MKYFLHDSSSFDDEKITQLYIKFGYEGLGLFYTILEKLALQEKPVLTDVLKHQLKIGKRLNKIWCFMEEIGIISSNNGETFNKQLLNFSEKYQIKKQKNAKRISQWRKNQEDSESVTRYEHVRNTPKDNISKVKRSKVLNNLLLSELKNSDFEDSTYFEITISFYELFKKNLIEKGVSTNRIEKSKGSWVDSVRLLIEQDKYTIEDLRDVFKFLHVDEFWKLNILSTKKLREQFQTLLIKSRSNGKNIKNTSKGCTNEELAEVIGKHFAIDKG